MEETYLLTAFPVGLEASGMRGMMMRRVRAFQTLEKLLLEVNIPVMMMEKGLSGIMAVLLMDAVRG